ncbi:hypothetical protein JB92DRAFT_2937426 [Gautieria morchelliformis]|nr:hypothetical protein JB92DRAFT_2937426 [Gautieria morchelliformis]
MSESSEASNLKPHVEAWIEVDGQKLPKYGEETFTKEGSLVVSCWIASQPGKAFSICGERRNVTCISDVFVNGLRVKRTVHSNSHPDTWKLENTNDGRTCKNFEFSMVDLTDTGSTGGDLNIEEFGTIKIHYYRVKNIILKCERRGVKGYDVGPLDQPVRVDEKKKLVGFHSIALRAIAAEGSAKVWRCTCDRIDHNGSPWYTFLFKYRSIDYLQAEGIAPPPSDVKRQEFPPEASVPDDNNTDHLLMKLEDEEQHALETLERRQKKWHEHEEMCQKEDQEREEEFEKRRQEREERFDRERREKREQYEKERREREGRHLEERREMEERYEREKREREERDLEERHEREERYEKERVEREERHLKERQKRQAKLEELEEQYAEKAERGKWLRALRTQTSDRSRKRIRQETIPSALHSEVIEID